MAMDDTDRCEREAARSAVVFWVAGTPCISHLVLVLVSSSVSKQLMPHASNLVII